MVTHVCANRLVRTPARRDVEGCVRRPQGRAGDPLSPVPDLEGERGRAQLLAQELQEHESREPRDAHPDPRGERRGGWPGRALRCVISGDVRVFPRRARKPRARGRVGRSIRARVRRQVRLANLAHPPIALPQTSGLRRKRRWRVWTRRRWRRK